MAGLRVATRGSALARWQARYVATLLGGETEEVVVHPLGDRDKTTPLSILGGQGVFAKEVQAAVLEGRADIAVHAAKDLPASPHLGAVGLVMAAVPLREDPRDALVGVSLQELARGATVATGSPRRKMLLAAMRPDLVFRDLRGNLPTRLDRVPVGGAIVTAVAALRRLGLEDRIAETLDPAAFTPQVGQGALAIECRSDDGATMAILRRLDDAPSRRAVDAERAWLASVSGRCDVPVGAYAVIDSDRIHLSAVMADQFGHPVRDRMTGTDPVELGEHLAHRMLTTTGR